MTEKGLSKIFKSFEEQENLKVLKVSIKNCRNIKQRGFTQLSKTVEKMHEKLRIFRQNHDKDVKPVDIKKYENWEFSLRQQCWLRKKKPKKLV